MVLYKTTIVIWSEYDPLEEWGGSLEDLGREATSGNAYCSKMETIRVDDPPGDPDWDGTEFFGCDEDEDKDPLTEEIRETAWNLCKEFDAGAVSGKHCTKVHLTNFVSTKLEERFGAETENLYRTDWQKEVELFCQKYGYEM